MFYNTFSFNYETFSNQQYLLVFFLPFLILALILALTAKQQYRRNLFPGLIFIALVLSAPIFTDYYSFSNEYFFNLTIIGLASYCIFLLNHNHFVDSIVACFLILFLIQLYLGLDQAFSGGDQQGLSIKGSMKNSGVYAFYLVSNLPVFYFKCLRFQNTKILGIKTYVTAICSWSIFISVFVAVCYVIVLTQSRTATVCLIGTSFYILGQKYANEIKTSFARISKTTFRALVMVNIFGLIGFCVWLFRLKKLSSFGRIMGFDITIQHIRENFWLGTGIGRFTWYYPQWQAGYFANHSKPDLIYFISASESYIIFNEYLQLFITVGFVGFTLCGYGLVCFFRLKTQKNSDLLIAIKGTVVAILISGFTSYPLHVNIMMMMVGTYIALAFSFDIKHTENKIQQPIYYKNAVILICIVFSCCAFRKGYFIYCASIKWSSLRNSFGAKNLVEYKRIHPLLKNDGKFLIEYGNQLISDSSNIFDAIATLEKAKKILITRQGIEALTNAYRTAKKYELAIINQRFLINYLPNRFQPKYDLLQLYALNRDTVHLFELGNNILSMPVKIPSHSVAKIKQNTIKMLKQHQ
ncbi:hypothetical protein HDC90_000135 [Pedobacter sp. AK013]|uniref:O-antigen ligase family protein n=1 Tax=Pedobacter sp. AK013 TaxID=2723071 RepID=UPI00160E0CF3|nr:O-antigen ligase family protein [Pedobacter sp. AK013]MBB6235538.1 hypothetical protein [Pedobacter sp. AK013]